MIYKITILGIILATLNLFNLKADILPEYKNKKNEKLQRAPTGLFDNQRNSVSNIEFFTSNYGIFGFDVRNQVGGGYWPRNSKNQYIFAGGAWFAAQKPRPGAGLDENGKPIMKQYVAVTYDPSTAQSWFVPGRIRDKNDQPTFEADFNDIYKYRTYFSTDFNRATGEPLDPNDQYNWPIWDITPEDTLKYSRYFGLYIEDEEERDIETYPKGPAFISGEDIFATFKDSDLNYYPKGYGRAKQEGYPLYVQIEHMIYSWGFGQYKDFIFLKYDFINMSPDTLLQCWHAPIMDVDIARSPFTAFGAQNDRVAWYKCDSTLNMAVQWSDEDNGERGFGFGYLGFDYLESPSVKYYHTYDDQGNKIIIRPSATMTHDEYYNRDGDTLYRNENTVDDTGYLRKTRRVFPVEEQLGLVTFQNWSSQFDIREDEPRYTFMAGGIRNDDDGPGDKRFMMATGPYNMLPRDTARVVVGIILARTSKGGTPQGMDDCEDLKELEVLDIFAQEVYDNNFKSPIPPDRPRFIDWTPLNNGIMLKWDNSAELSIDEEADGLDFLGYKLYRARRPELDTFSISQTSPEQDNAFPNGTGPLGWKQIANFNIPSPVLKSPIIAGDGNPEVDPRIDMLMIAGPVVNRGQAAPEDEPYDLYAMHVLRIPEGALIYDSTTSDAISSSSRITNEMRGKKLPFIAAIDTTSDSMVEVNGRSFLYTKPWAKYFLEVAGGSEGFNDADGAQPFLYYDYFNMNSNNPLMDSILVGTVELERSLVAVNPLHYKRRNIKVSQSLVSYIDYLKNTPGAAQVIDGNEVIVRAKELTDSVEYELVAKDTVDQNGEPVTVFVRDTVYVPDPDNPGEMIPKRNEFLIEIPKVDSVYYYNTLRQPFGTNEWTIDISIQRSEAEIMSDRRNINETLDSLYRWILNGKARVEWPGITDSIGVKIDSTFEPPREVIVYGPVQFEQTRKVRNEVITDYMDYITNNRTFIDVGDDDRNGLIKTEEDPTQTEKLINNVDYFYKLIPYDEGDYTKDFPQQPNATPFSSNFNIITNMIKVFPEATPVGPEAKIEVIEQTDSLLGGIHNVRFFAINNDRVKQLYAGDTLELTWEPVWFPGQWVPIGEINDERSVNYSLLGRSIRLTNISDNNKVLYEQMLQFSPIACTGGLVGQLTENAGSYVLAIPDSVLIDSASVRFVDGVAEYDTITLNQLNSMDYVQRSGHFTTGNFEKEDWCYVNGFSEEAYGIFGFEYDFTVRQYGGLYRPALAEKLGSAKDRHTVLKMINQNKQFNTDKVHATQVVGVEENGITLSREQNSNQQFVSPDYNFITHSFNNGPGEYLVEFLPGGTEEHTFKYNGLPDSPNSKEITFELTYLNVKVTNNLEVKRLDRNSGDSVLIPVKSEVKNVELPVSDTSFFYDLEQLGITKAYYPHPKNLLAAGRDPMEFYGNFNIYSVGWIDLRNAPRRIDSLFDVQRARYYAYPTNFDYPEEEAENNAPYTGLQGKYYLSASAIVEGEEIWIDFNHVLNIAGTQFVLDFANTGRLVPKVSTDARTYGEGNRPEDDYPPLSEAQDFQPGDQLKLTSWGSALGLPYPDARVRAVVKTESADYQYTEEDLDDIGVVPNPYYINHQNQRSPYNSQLYFTRLPKECTIKIFTMAGDLVKEIEHVANQEGERRSVQVWDLMTRNGFRTQSQALIAVITTPNGETVTKTFSIVVGSFRIID